MGEFINKILLDFLIDRANVIAAGDTELWISVRNETRNGNKIIVLYINNLKIGIVYPEEVDTKKPPKHSGGKKTYGKLQTEWLSNNPKASLTVIGAVVKLTPNIEWDTGKIVDKRTKKPLIIDSITKVLGVTKKTTIKLLKESRESGIISHTKEGYFVSPNFIKKGVSK